MTTTAQLALTHMEEGQDQGEVTYNEMLNRIDALMFAGVIDRSLTAPPGSPTNGDRYIVGPSSTGAWASQDGKLALYYDGWIFFAPKEGWHVWVNDENTFIIYNGTAWIDAPADAYFEFTITVQGSTGSPSTITIQLKDAGGADIAATCWLRARVCNSGGWTNATNATIAAGSGTSAVETHTANKDITFQSNASGAVVITLTDASAETVTLRIGPASIGARRADYHASQNVTHA